MIGEYLDGDLIAAPLRNNNIGKSLGGLNKLKMAGADRLFIPL